jgi:hypothetical protein
MSRMFLGLEVGYVQVVMRGDVLRIGGGNDLEIGNKITPNVPCPLHRRNRTVSPMGAKPHTRVRVTTK